VILQHVHQLVADRGGPRRTDRELLDDFAARRDEAAFSALVARHGPMVLRVCRRVLGHEQDAEDAFQATFLVLSQRVGSIRKREAVANWLHGVANRTAMKARRSAARRRNHEAKMRERTAEMAVSPTWDDVQAVLDEEIQRLPGAYRAAFLHCVIEGKSGPQAAAELGVAEGALWTRLTRARQLLRRRLTRRGIELAAVLAGLAVSSAARAGVSTVLVNATVRFGVAAGGTAAAAIPSHVAALAAGVTQAMFMTKAKIATALLLAVGLIVAGVGVHHALAAKGTPPLVQKTEPAAKEDAKPRGAPPADDRALPQGTWVKFETVVERRGDKTLPPKEVKVNFVVTSDAIIRIGDDGFVSDRWAYTLDPNKSPRAIDLSNPKYGIWRGIYRIEGETLTICLNDEGVRPSEFSPKADWVFKRVSQTPKHVTQRYENAPGCIWMGEPRTPDPHGSGWGGVVYFYETDSKGAALITLAYSHPGKLISGYRPVILDANGKRYLPDQQQAIGSARQGGHAVALVRYRLDPKVLQANQVAAVGVEGITDDACRIAAREAEERARKAGIEVLPWPEVGKVYPFTLTSLDGGKLRSADLKGKVVVIDCWASWCSPCLALVPELKRCYEKGHKDGLEIIGVCLDDAETARKVSKSHGMTWPQVMAPPATNEAGELWRTAMGLQGIPRVLVIDREGILRADNPAKVEEEIARLLEASKRPTR
jgi:RNA polymerase sigma factor (sigma-70 family)